LEHIFFAHIFFCNSVMIAPVSSLYKSMNIIYGYFAFFVFFFSENSFS